MDGENRREDSTGRGTRHTSDREGERKNWRILCILMKKILATLPEEDHLLSVSPRYSVG
jgi:hypothetical protein